MLIDELDRCSPSYSVKMLERIKHYFDDDRIIFVFSTDLSQLTHTIKKFYGEGYDSCRYLNRFFDLRLRLPEINLEKYCINIEFNDNNSFITIASRQIIKKYNLSLRQINKFYKLLKISTFNIFKKNILSIQFYTSFVNPLVIALSIIDIKQYNEFISGRDPISLVELLKDLYNTRCKFTFEGRFLNSEEYENIDNDDIYVKLQERFKKMYEAIFIEDYSKEYQIYVGKLHFDIEIKGLIQNSLNLLSDLSYFEE